jgi:ArsR family transcriptional regulator
MFKTTNNKRIGQLFKALGDPFRVRLLLSLSEQEACVCHLERLLGKRQAYISQHLMSLRGADIVTAHRKGKYIFYRLKDTEVLDLIRHAAVIAGLTNDELKATAKTTKLSSCECPQCGRPQLISIKH